MNMVRFVTTTEEGPLGLKLLVVKTKNLVCTTWIMLKFLPLSISDLVNAVIYSHDCMRTTWHMTQT